jgi:hypothetical protein
MLYKLTIYAHGNHAYLYAVYQHIGITMFVVDVSCTHCGFYVVYAPVSLWTLCTNLHKKYLFYVHVFVKLANPR